VKAILHSSHAGWLPVGDLTIANRKHKYMPRMKVSVVSDTPDEYRNKKTGELVKSQVLSVQDVCPSGARLKNTFDYPLAETEKEKFAGKLVDKVIELDVTELTPAPFGGRLRARGHIHSTPLDAAKK
jgi:hypothetical protein